MNKYYIRVWCMSASYELGAFYASSREDAIKQARKTVMPDQRSWNFSEYEPDENDD